MFPALPPASYSVRVALDGFKTAERQHVVLQIGQQTDLSFVLEVGTQAEITVLGSGASPLNTVNSELGTTSRAPPFSTYRCSTEIPPRWCFSLRA